MTATVAKVETTKRWIYKFQRCIKLVRPNKNKEQSFRLPMKVSEGQLKPTTKPIYLHHTRRFFPDRKNSGKKIPGKIPDQSLEKAFIDF